MSNSDMSTTAPTPICQALRNFASSVRSKTASLVSGEPEAQLRAPFDQFMQEVGKALSWDVVCTDESRLANKLGCPDFAIQRDGLLTGYAELKAPHTGADSKRFKGHNREQFKRFSGIPNIVYTDGNDWALYRNGELARPIVRLSGDVITEGAAAVSDDDAAALQSLLHDYLIWEPILPLDRKGNLDLKNFAELLAPLCRMLRNDVADSLGNQDSPIMRLATDWRDLLFPDATNEQFADAYAQTVTFALLLGRSEGADPLTLANTQNALATQHNLLSRALQVLTDDRARDEMLASLNLLLRVVSIVPPTAFGSANDPWLYFYEDFLASYDPKLRKDAGAYYTPVEVVRAQVRLIDELLINKFGKQWGLADKATVILDPAAGTGTYLLGVIEHTLSRIETEQGIGAVENHAKTLSKNLIGFERMVSPYAVCDLRVSRALQDKGAKDSSALVYLTDTLESPNSTPPQLPLFFDTIAEQHQEALAVKSNVPVLVCLGNPPYGRHEATTSDNGHRTGSWIRWGDNGDASKSILADFTTPVKETCLSKHLKSLYNYYVYFWRWALWKVFEQDTSTGDQDTSTGGIVSFITASSYLWGPAFVGMREVMRRVCDEIWIIDLGGEGRGSRKTENVFAIKTPVAIAFATRSGKENNTKPAKVRYTKIEGNREQKLAALNDINSLDEIEWQDCPNDWHSPFRPKGEGIYFTWPLLTDLMPWQHSGVQLKRTWPIAPDKETLELRWRKLMEADNRSDIFRETADRKISGEYRNALVNIGDSTPIAELPEDAQMPNVVEYAYRAFDRQCIIADERLISRPRPELWHLHHANQIYFASQLTQTLGNGPALAVCASIPDLDHITGGGGKNIIPLYRSRNSSIANFTTELIEFLSYEYKTPIKPEDLFAYIYGVLANPTFTDRFFDELESKELRLPLTKDLSLFEEAKKIGSELIYLHTYCRRFLSKQNKPPNQNKLGVIPRGSVKCVENIADDSYPESFEYDKNTGTLHIGKGKFQPVPPELYDFEVSGRKVVQSWLGYRIKNGAGRKSSQLDYIQPKQWNSKFITELLELLWVLEKTIALYPKQTQLLDKILEGDCLTIDDLPDPLPHKHELRNPPKIPKENQNGSLWLAGDA